MSDDVNDKERHIEDFRSSLEWDLPSAPHKATQNSGAFKYLEEHVFPHLRKPDKTFSQFDKFAIVLDDRFKKKEEKTVTLANCKPNFPN